MTRDYPYDDDPYDRVRRASAPAPKAPRAPISARPEPEGVSILDNHRRAGDAQRDTYVRHLEDLHARGYLPQQEFDARQTAALKAETEWDLNRLIADTPGLVEPHVPTLKRALRSPSSLLAWLPAHKDSTVLHALGFIAWGFATVAWASIVPGLLGFYANHPSPFQVAGMVFFIVTAVVSVVAEIVAYVAYVDA